MRLLSGANKPLGAQIPILREYLHMNPVLLELLYGLPEMGLPPYYVAGGAIFQTVWNVGLGRRPDDGIGDYDIVYWDEDTSYAAEDAVINKVQKAYPDITLDIKNQNRVRLWAPQRFGTPIAQCTYVNLEESFSKFPFMCNCVGVRLEDELVVCAPYGLHDVFSMLIRYNMMRGAKTQQWFIQNQGDKWKRQWPEATIL